MTRRQILDNAINTIQEGSQTLDDLRAEYEEWRDSMPENLQGSTTYEKLDEVIDMLDDAIDGINTVTEELESLELPLGFGRG